MLHYLTLVPNLKALTSGVVSRSSVLTRHTAQSVTQACIRNTVSSMFQYHTSQNATSVLSIAASGGPKGLEPDRTWNSSRGIKFDRLLRKETLHTQDSQPILERSSLLESTIAQHSSVDLANTSSEDYIGFDVNQTIAGTNVSQMNRVQPHQEETRLTELSLRSPLGYHIPEAKMRDLMLSSSAYWQYNLYEGPGGEKVDIHYCKNIETTERVAHLFLGQKVVGFDIEWMPGALAWEGVRRNVALIQLASEERIALFHLARFPKGDPSRDFLAPTLWKILESPEITKVGVSVKADCTRLRRSLGIDPRGLLELSHLYKLVKFSHGDVKKINKVLVSLAQQVQEHLHLPLWKGDVRTSNWAEELDHDQRQYAASDSYAGLQLYHVLESKRKALSPTPPCPAHVELNLAIRLADGQTVATYDKPTEFNNAISPTASEAGVSIEELARDFIDVTIGDLVAPMPDLDTSRPKDGKTSPSSLGLQLSAANRWVAQWRSTLSPNYKPRALTCQLRAYALWHNQLHSIATAAAILRDPPLQKSTVASYVLEALKSEKLPFEVTRLIEVVKYLPESAHGRNESFLKKCGLLQNLNRREKDSILSHEQEQKRH